MDQVHVVRHKVLVEGRSQRAVARELGLARMTVGKYVAEAAPVRKAEARPLPRPVWDKVGARVHALLTDSGQWTRGKQRLTATRLNALLVAEGHAVGVTAVREAVAEWKRQRREVFVPLTYRPGDLAEVDFFEVLVDGKSSPWPVVILPGEAERAKDYAVTAASKASGSVTAPGAASAASVAVSRYLLGSTPASFADSHSV